MTPDDDPGDTLAPVLGASARAHFRGNDDKLSDRLAIDLGTEVVRGALAPGERLATEAGLSDTFGVSRTVVRDALRTLAALGLVAVRQGRGIYVADADSTPLNEVLLILLMRSELTTGDVIAARAALETELAPLAAQRGTEEDWTIISDSLGAAGAALEREAWSDLHRWHLRFHLQILNAVNLPALELLLRPVQQLIMLSSIPPRMDDVEMWGFDLHQPILEALRRRDGSAVRTAMQAHFEYLSDTYSVVESSLFRDVPAAQQLLTEILAGRRPDLLAAPPS